MFQRLVFSSASVLALLWAAAAPGTVHAQHARGGFHSTFHGGSGGFSRGFEPRSLDPRFGGFDRRFDRGFSDPRFGAFDRDFDRRFFDPRFRGFGPPVFSGRF